MTFRTDKLDQLLATLDASAKGALEVRARSKERGVVVCGAGVQQPQVLLAELLDVGPVGIGQRLRLRGDRDNGHACCERKGE